MTIAVITVNNNPLSRLPCGKNSRQTKIPFIFIQKNRAGDMFFLINQTGTGINPQNMGSA